MKDAELDDALNEEFELRASALGSTHVRLFGKPLDMGDGETTEETISGTVEHFAASVEAKLRQLSATQEQLTRVLAEKREMVEALKLTRDYFTRSDRTIDEQEIVDAVERAIELAEGKGK